MKTKRIRSGAFIAWLSLALSDGVVQPADGQIACGTPLVWGCNPLGQTNVPAALTNIIGLAGGFSHSVALLADGTVCAWGTNQQGQPIRAPAGLSNIIAVAAGDYHDLALTSRGKVIAWGANDHGQTNVPLDLSNVVAVAGSTWASMALRSDGVPVVWGYSGWGQTAVPSTLTNAVAIAAGSSHCMALTAQGSVETWGSYSGYVSPVFLTNIIAIAAARNHDLALRDDGTVIPWGYYYDGVNYVPAGVSNVIAITTAAGYQVALMGDGTLRMWGGNEGTYSGMQGILSLGSGWCHTLALANPEAAMFREPPLLNVSKEAATLEFTVPTISGKVYQLQWQSALGGAWNSGPLVAGTGQPIKFQDASANGSQKFYRVRKF